MKTPHGHESPLDPPDEIERLICRALDGEITPGEQNTLDGLLRSDPKAARLWTEYRRIDELAARTLSRHAVRSAAIGTPSRKAEWWIPAAGAVLAAAAVVAFSFVSTLYDAPSPPRQPAGDRPIHRQLPPVQSPARFIDYRPTDSVPAQRRRVVRQDLIGIPGETENVFYLYEVSREGTQIVPLAAEF